MYEQKEKEQLNSEELMMREAQVCSRMLTYAHVCSRMLTYAHVCSRMLTYAHVCSRMLTYAHVCSRVLTYGQDLPPVPFGRMWQMHKGQELSFIIGALFACAGLLTYADVC